MADDSSDLEMQALNFVFSATDAGVEDQVSHIQNSADRASVFLTQLTQKLDNFLTTSQNVFERFSSNFSMSVAKMSSLVIPTLPSTGYGNISLRPDIDTLQSQLQTAVVSAPLLLIPDIEALQTHLLSNPTLVPVSLVVQGGKENLNKSVSAMQAAVTAAQNAARKSTASINKTFSDDPLLRVIRTHAVAVRKTAAFMDQHTGTFAASAVGAISRITRGAGESIENVSKRMGSFQRTVKEYTDSFADNTFLGRSVKSFGSSLRGEFGAMQSLFSKSGKWIGESFLGNIVTPESRSAMSKFYGRVFGDKSVVGKIAGSFKSGIGDILGKFTAILGLAAIIDKIFGPALEILSAFMSMALAPLQYMLMDVMVSMQPMFAMIGDLIFDLAKVLGPLLISVAKTVTPIISFVIGGLVKLITYIASTEAGMFALKAVVLAFVLQAMVGLYTSLVAAIPLIVAAVAAFWPFFAVALIITGVVVAVRKLFGWIERLGGVAVVFTRIKDWVVGLFKIFMGTKEPTGFLGGMVKILGFFSPLRILYNLFKSFIGIFTGGVGEPKGVTGFLSRLVNFLVPINRITNAFQTLWHWITGHSPGIMPALKDLGSVISAFISVAADALVSVINAISNAVVNVVGAFTNFFLVLDPAKLIVTAGALVAIAASFAMLGLSSVGLFATAVAWTVFWIALPSMGKLRSAADSIYLLASGIASLSKRVDLSVFVNTSKSISDIVSAARGLRSTSDIWPRLSYELSKLATTCTKFVSSSSGLSLVSKSFTNISNSLRSAVMYGSELLKVLNNFSGINSAGISAKFEQVSTSITKFQSDNNFAVVDVADTRAVVPNTVSLLPPMLSYSVKVPEVKVPAIQKTPDFRSSFDSLKDAVNRQTRDIIGELTLLRQSKDTVTFNLGGSTTKSRFAL